MTSDLRPWLGLASFTEAHAAQFFGREAEVAELVRRLSRKGLTVLFGQSGLGKTSMLQAGVVPRMREAGFAPVLLRMDYSAESPSPGAQMLAALGWSQDEGLWEQLHRRDREGQPPLLVFDQFEEVFTLGQADEAGRAKAADFLTLLADLVENRVPATLEARLEEDDNLFERYNLHRGDFRLLISLREDYLAHLEPLKSAMPGITQNRMRIAPMTGEQAMQAVCGPGGELVSTDTAEAIVCFVSGARSIQHAEVEPALLSLILRELNEQRIAKGRAQMTPDLLAGSHAAILSDFYERSLADQPSGVRHFIENQLLTDTGYRENVAEERVRQAFAAAGAQPDALEQLVNRRLLRVEERLDRRRVELTHDTLCAVVAASRDNRLERQRAEAAERQATEQRASEARALAQARAARVALRRSRMLMAGAFALAAFALGASGWAWKAQKDTEAARIAAETARDQAQSLMGYLLEDFYEDLLPVGRTTLVSTLGQRLVAYYDGLPASLQGKATEAQRARAELRTASSLNVQSQHDTASELLNRAKARFEKLRRDGDQSLETRLGLAAVLARQAMVLDGQSRTAEALVLARQAAELLPADTRGFKPADRLASWGILHPLLLFLPPENGEERERAGLRALAILREGGADRPPSADDPWSVRLARAFVEASSWRLQRMPELREDLAEREATAAAALLQADRLLALDAGNVLVRNTRAGLWRTLAEARAAQLDIAEAERLTRRAIRERLQLVEQDPRRTAVWNNLGTAQAALATMTWRSGRIQDALELAKVPVANLQNRPRTGLIVRNLQDYLQNLLELQADVGDWPAAEASRAAMYELLDWRAAPERARPATLAVNECLKATIELAFTHQRRQAEEAPRAALQQRMKAVAAGQWPETDQWLVTKCQTEGAEVLARIGLDARRWDDAILALQQALQLQRPPLDEFMRRDDTRRQALLALALHRAGRSDDARHALAPALEWLAATRKPGHADQQFRLLDLGARQLEAELAPPGRSAALQAAVRTELKLLVPEMRRLASTRDWLRWFGLS